jgi:hypothetical protein
MLMRPGAEQENKGYTLRVKKARLPPGLLARNVAPYVSCPILIFLTLRFSAHRLASVILSTSHRPALCS